MTINVRAATLTTPRVSWAGSIWRRPCGGRRLHAFFSTLYYAGPRPEEAVAIRVLDARLPAEDDEDQWGELMLHTARPEVGKQWTDAGKVHEVRGLKGRPRTTPALCRVVRR
ncbi:MULTISPECIES: hypothetical protein [unclassified Streptomyces]|uniref:hypothetical protein n=1 Tax=unclassified Streptomyces TaxID=2593676 RepID=UPI001319C026|nr:MULTISPECIES: hypothetical protein [unclassified Streptomyces]MYX31943.1 hypothetical protein [Streptomyces sp. SID8377]